MKVLLLNQFFHPDLSATSQIATDLAEDLVTAGMNVTALAGRGSYLGGQQLAQRSVHRGVEIVRASATSFGKRTLFHRAADYASFYLAATAALARLPRHDVVVAMTTPPLIAATALALKGVKRARLVYWVQDLYPDVAVAFGALKPRALVARLMAATSHAVMARADRIVVLGEAMGARCIAGGARPTAVSVIPNWSDGDSVRPIEHSGNRLRSELARGARTLVMYSGNIGQAHDIVTLLDAARRLHGRSDIAFIFVGEGVQRALVEAAARELPNVRLAPYQPREQLAESLSAGDLHLIGLSQEVEGLIEPSKLYGIMAVGRPALYVGPKGSEVARTILRHDCGRIFANGDSEGLALAIGALADAPEERLALGRRARAALTQHYTRSVATGTFRQLLETLCADSPRVA
ncbi:glycosyltransferase family 4 protein [Anaeromyxobacter sp. PSR-1]|uniref:glycosyltransferase family 4 protein n=1 Tax=Anaeromyxobacter sp. PSR-1 TaxID=1300915 RepID=UPI0005DFB17E|nr:glycosyltransferase family 4 protein [Anaeromyxobacter sp. PSR-1]GAO01360.1 putative glycosyltransferase WbjE [Anaeromyxobacter sp. PSR-1]